MTLNKSGEETHKKYPSLQTTGRQKVAPIGQALAQGERARQQCAALESNGLTSNAWRPSKQQRRRPKPVFASEAIVAFLLNSIFQAHRIECDLEVELKANPQATWCADRPKARIR